MSNKKWFSEVDCPRLPVGTSVFSSAPYAFNEEIYWIQESYDLDTGLFFPTLKEKRRLVRYRGRYHPKDGDAQAIVMKSDGEMVYVDYSELKPLT